jgi:hypothetical protein
MKFFRNDKFNINMISILLKFSSNNKAYIEIVYDGGS